MEKTEEARRFSILRSISHAEISYSHTKRTQEIEVRLYGALLASCARFFKRGKEYDRQFYISEAGVALSNP
jgi:hypothetical protein